MGISWIFVGYLLGTCWILVGYLLDSKGYQRISFFYFSGFGKNLCCVQKNLDSEKSASKKRPRLFETIFSERAKTIFVSIFFAEDTKG